MSLIGKINSRLVDESAYGYQARKECAVAMGIVQNINEVAKIVSMATSFFGLLLATYSPMRGLQMMLSGVAGFFISREVSVISANVENLVKAPLLERAIDAIAPAVLDVLIAPNRDVTSAKYFVNKVTRDTAFVGPYCGDAIAKMLQC